MQGIMPIKTITNVMAGKIEIDGITPLANMVVQDLKGKLKRLKAISLTTWDHMMPQTSTVPSRT